jgi:hypothetical protein
MDNGLVRMDEESGFAICKYCDKAMKPGNGCTFGRIRIGRKTYKRIAADENDMNGEGVCHDCNAVSGQYHHFECDMEECPVCHGQLFVCGCDIKYLK